MEASFRIPLPKWFSAVTTASVMNATSQFCHEPQSGLLVRPAMYDSFHDIEIFRDGGEPDTDLVEQSIVGNICESGDILAKKRMLPLIKEGDIVAALDAGAYGFVMSSSYNQRPRAAEVLITSDGTPKLIRRRETLDDLTRCFVEE